MDFTQTALPDKPIFRQAFAAGWARCLEEHGKNEIVAAHHYMRGPVSMARLICQHGGQRHEMAAAAALAGPSLFCQKPSKTLNPGIRRFSQEVDIANVSDSRELPGVMSRVSESVGLFLQASAVMLLERLGSFAGFESQKARMKAYDEALNLYSASRGCNDKYNLDSRFEAAAQKVSATSTGTVTFGEGPAARREDRIFF